MHRTNRRCEQSAVCGGCRRGSQVRATEESSTSATQVHVFTSSSCSRVVFAFRLLNSIAIHFFSPENMLRLIGAVRTVGSSNGHTSWHALLLWRCWRLYLKKKSEQILSRSSAKFHVHWFPPFRFWSKNLKNQGTKQIFWQWLWQNACMTDISVVLLIQSIMPHGHGDCTDDANFLSLAQTMYML